MSSRRLVIPDILDCLTEMGGETGSYREVARLFGAAEARWQRDWREAVEIADRSTEVLGLHRHTENIPQLGAVMTSADESQIET
jgi:hypothetical protein